MSKLTPQGEALFIGALAGEGFSDLDLFPDGSLQTKPLAVSFILDPAVELPLFVRAEGVTASGHEFSGFVEFFLGAGEIKDWCVVLEETGIPSSEIASLHQQIGDAAMIYVRNACDVVRSANCCGWGLRQKSGPVVTVTESATLPSTIEETSSYLSDAGFSDAEMSEARAEDFNATLEQDFRECSQRFALRAWRESIDPYSDIPDATADDVRRLGERKCE